MLNTFNEIEKCYNPKKPCSRRSSRNSSKEPTNYIKRGSKEYITCDNENKNFNENENFELLIKQFKEQNEKLKNKNNLLRNENKKQETEINELKNDIQQVKTILRKLLSPKYHNNSIQCYDEQLLLIKQLLKGLKNINEDISENKDENVSLPGISSNIQELKGKLKDVLGTTSNISLSKSVDIISNKLSDIDKCSIELWDSIIGNEKRLLPADICKRIDIAIKFISLLKKELKKCGYRNTYLYDKSEDSENKIKDEFKTEQYKKLEKECRDLKDKLILLEDQMKRKIMLYIDAMSELLQCVSKSDKSTNSDSYDDPCDKESNGSRSNDYKSNDSVFNDFESNDYESNDFQLNDYKSNGSKYDDSKSNDYKSNE